jgi:FKBP-type peptidyl-prolyl cis-trans isomerase FklB
MYDKLQHIAFPKLLFRIPKSMLIRATVAAFMLIMCNPIFVHAQEQVDGVVAPIVPANAAALKDPSSYGIGFSIGLTLARDGISDKEVDAKDLMTGIMDAIERRQPKLNNQQMQGAMQVFEERMKKKMQQIAVMNLEKAKVYLEENKKKDGIQITKTGLQYKVLKTGTGKSPGLQDKVVIHYEGKLIDGTVFDSTAKSNMPSTLPVSLFPGWTEALQRMKEGDKWQITMPPNLAHGQQGFPPAIGPNEALIFEIELLEIAK